MSQWTKEHENILKEWKAKAFAYLWLQTQSCYFYIKIYNWLAYIVIILSSFASATMLSLTDSSTNVDCTCNYTAFGVPIIIVQYVIGSFSLLSAILTSVIRQLKPGEMYQHHASTSKRYHNLIRSIDACLSLTPVLRPEPSHFIEKAGIELENLADNQIEPPLGIIKKFEKIYGPLDKILYGEDIIELWKLGYQTEKAHRKIMKKNATSDTNSEMDNTRVDIYKSDDINSRDYTNSIDNGNNELQNVVIDMNNPIEENNIIINGAIKNINQPFKMSSMVKQNISKFENE
jgi:hypothetical protein